MNIFLQGRCKINPSQIPDDRCLEKNPVINIHFALQLQTQRSVMNKQGLMEFLACQCKIQEFWSFSENCFWGAG